VSANKRRAPGQPVHPKPKPGLRLVKSPDERPRPTPDPELKAMLDDMKRRQRERLDRGPDDRDAA
jgi:hypothetical protein